MCQPLGHWGIVWWGLSPFGAADCWGRCLWWTGTAKSCLEPRIALKMGLPPEGIRHVNKSQPQLLNPDRGSQWEEEMVSFKDWPWEVLWIKFPKAQLSRDSSRPIDSKELSQLVHFEALRLYRSVNLKQICPLDTFKPVSNWVSFVSRMVAVLCSAGILFKEGDSRGPLVYRRAACLERVSGFSWQMRQHLC